MGEYADECDAKAQVVEDSDADAFEQAAKKADANVEGDDGPGV